MSTRAQTAAGYRLRPAPRRRTRGRSASRIQWDKVGRVALVIVVFLVLVSYVSPSLNFLDAWRDTRSEHAALADLREESARLKQRIAKLDTADAEERAARKQGLIEPGEKPYTIKFGH